MSAGIRARQKAHTRAVLVTEAKRLFASRGYSAVSLPEVVQAAGVTKGALYHHFESKSALFAAVLKDVQQHVARTVAARAEAHTDLWGQLTAGCRAFLEASTAPDVRRIMLIDGPAVLGWPQWRAVDEATSGRHLAEVLTALVQQGIIAPQPVAPLTHLLTGAMNEAALWLAESSQPDDLSATTQALNLILEALRTDASQPSSHYRCIGDV